MSTSPTVEQILSAIAGSAAAQLATDMPLGTSTLAGVPAAGTSSDLPLTTLGSGEVYSLPCILRAAAGVMEFASTQYDVDAINPGSLASSVLIFTGLLETTDVGLEARPNGKQKLRLVDLSSIKDISSRMRTKKMVETFYLSAINTAVVPAAASQTYLSYISSTAVSLIKGANPDLAPEGMKDASDRIQKLVANFGGCAKAPAVSAVADTKAAQYGGKAYTDLTPPSATAVEAEPIVVPWTSSRPHTFGGAGVLIEMVDRNNNAVSVTKADGALVYGVQFNISPETLTVNSVQVINRFQTMASWVEEHWGGELDQISFSGKSFSFNVQLATRYLTILSRRDSGAYQELRDLMSLYQTNGLVLQGPSVHDGSRQIRKFYVPTSQKSVRQILNHPRTGMVKERLYVRLTFQGFMQCLGYFESIEVTEDAQNPYQMSYSVNFKSEMTTYTIGRELGEDVTGVGSVAATVSSDDTQATSG